EEVHRLPARADLPGPAEAALREVRGVRVAVVHVEVARRDGRAGAVARAALAIGAAEGARLDLAGLTAAVGGEAVAVVALLAGVEGAVAAGAAGAEAATARDGERPHGD